MRALTVGVFVIIGIALLVTEVLARYTTARVPTLSTLLRWAMRRRSAQIGLVMAWWWIGWHFLGSW